jgi:toxin secretion/phage lysis holin
MKEGKEMEKVSNSIKGAGGIIVSVMTLIFGQFWFLFAFYLGLNITDWITGWAKARKKNEGSSAIGIRGIAKKTGYWVIIAIAFGCSFVFIKLGEIININLAFMIWMGWFTLATLIVNEIVSILENLKDLGYIVPYILIKGLKISGDFIDAAGKKFLSGKELEE